MPVGVDERIGVGQELVALVTVREQLELLRPMRPPQQPVLLPVQDIQHRRLEGVPQDDLVVIVVAAGNDFAVPLDLERPVFRSAARGFHLQRPMARAEVPAVAEVVRLPDLDRVRPRLPIGSEGVHVRLVFLHHEIRKLQLRLFEAARGALLQKTQEVVCRRVVIQPLHDYVVRLWPHPVEAHPHLVQAGFDQALGPRPRNERPVRDDVRIEVLGLGIGDLLLERPINQRLAEPRQHDLRGPQRHNLVDAAPVFLQVHDPVRAPVLVLITRAHDADRIAVVGDFVPDFRMAETRERLVVLYGAQPLVAVKSVPSHAAVVQQLRLSQNFQFIAAVAGHYNSLITQHFPRKPLGSPPPPSRRRAVWLHSTGGNYRWFARAPFHQIKRF